MQQSSITGFFKKAPRPNASREDSNNDRQERRPAPYRPRGGSSSHSMRSESSTSSTRGSSSTPSARGNHRGGKSPRNMELRKVAEETKAVLPALLKSLPGFGVSVSSLHDLNGLSPLDAKKCPGHVLPSSDKDAGKIGTRIRVLDKDSFDAAIELQPDYTARVHMSGQPAAAASPPTPNADISDDEEMDLDNLPLHPKSAPQPWDLSSKPAAPKPPPPQPTQFQSTRKPVAVLNLASERHPGGGWQTGAMAQEEALCYRSSLYRSLRRRFYPLPSLSVIHTPSVLLIRSSNSSGHKLYNLPTPDLPVTSVISVAALRHPDLTPDGKGFASAGQRAETKRKIRISLRVAAANGHTKLVLGALGCGVFANPAGDVAQCFLEVFREGEFQGGWWEDVVFAVMDNVKDGEGGRNGKGNFGEFWRVLDGKVV